VMDGSNSSVANGGRRLDYSKDPLLMPTLFRDALVNPMKEISVDIQHDPTLNHESRLEE
jgi:hypothetical protein